MEIDRARILELVQILKASSAAELAVEEGGVTVRLVRAATPAAADPVVTVTTTDEAANAETPAETPAPTGPSAEVFTVTSRFVGLFYPGKEPGGPPLVEVGQEVAEGQVLGVVEVLRKPMDVTSPVSGILVETMAEEGTPVQYGDPLFAIRV